MAKTYSFMYNTNVQSDKNVSEWIFHQFVKILGGGLWTMGPPPLHGEKLDPHTRGTLPHYMPSTSGLWYFNKMPTPNRLGMDSNAPFASDFHQQRKTKLVGTLPVTWEENNLLFIRGEHTLSLRISSGSSQTSYTIFKKILTINLLKRLRMDYLHHFFQKFSRGDHDPPPPHYCERTKKNPSPLGFYMILYS